MSQRILRYLSAITFCVADLDVAEAAWRDYLDYRTVDRGAVDDLLCAVWATPNAAGQKYCLMQPASGADVYLRFVETGHSRPFGPPGWHGWCAAEFLVLDPDALAERLQGSPFRRLGGPADLFPRAKAPRAMQMVGPSGEIVYFTRILPGGSRYGLKGARADVDRAFIVPVGGPSMTAMQHFYGETLGLRTLDPTPFINPIMAHVCGVLPQTIFPTAVVPIPGRRFLVELDELPATAMPRPRSPGCLPPGMAMVTFLTDDLDAVTAPLRAQPQLIDGPPYNGRRTAVIEGAAGEWLELIEDRGREGEPGRS